MIEIVNNHYSVKLPHYAALLHYQLSSLTLHPSRDCLVRYRLFATADDPAAWKVIRFHEDRLGTNLIVHVWTPGEVGRRSIGRNHSSKVSDADILWFADGDFAFCFGILDRLAAMPWPEGVELRFPKVIMAQKEHKAGDRMAKELDLDHLKLEDVDPVDFMPQRFIRAIGGVQIVRGDWAREHGYLPYGKWQEPTPTPFRDTKDDVEFRRQIKNAGGRAEGIDLPGVYRLRHSTCARY